MTTPATARPARRRLAATTAVVAVTVMAAGAVSPTPEAQAGPRTTATWSDTSVLRDQPVEVSGRTGAGWRVRVQRREGSSWVSAGSTKAGSDGAYSLLSASPKVGSFAHRVVASRGPKTLTSSTTLVHVSPGSTRAEARVSGARVRVGRAAWVVASVNPDWVGGTARLEQRQSGVWQPVATAAVEDAVLAFRAPTGWFGSRSFRVVALDGEGAVLATSDPVVSRVVPPYRPGGPASDHAHYDTTPRWDPCSTIRWQVNLTKAPRGALEDVKEAVRRVAQATGLTFAYRGKSKRNPQDYAETGPDADLLVAWTSVEKSQPLRDNGGRMVGLALSTWQYGYQDLAGSPASRMTSGVILMNTAYNGYKAGFGKGYTRGEVLVHELSHVTGLTHARSESQLMYPMVTKRDARWGAGDLAGLELVGADQGCLAVRTTGRVAPSEGRGTNR